MERMYRIIISFAIVILYVVVLTRRFFQDLILIYGFAGHIFVVLVTAFFVGVLCIINLSDLRLGGQAREKVGAVPEIPNLFQVVSLCKTFIRQNPESVFADQINKILEQCKKLIMETGKLNELIRYKFSDNYTARHDYLNVVSTIEGLFLKDVREALSFVTKSNEEISGGRQKTITTESRQLRLKTDSRLANVVDNGEKTLIRINKLSSEITQMMASEFSNFLSGQV